MPTSLNRNFPIFIDIGSYKGDEINWAMLHEFEVHAFEPNPRMKPYLEKYEEYAKINYAAALDYDGVTKLYEKNQEWETDMGRSVIPEKTNLSQTFEEVPCINIGRYLAEIDKDIEIVKIDAEGAEYRILESIITHFDPKRIKHLLVEDHSKYIHNWHDHKRDVLQKYQDRGILVEAWDNNLNKYV